MVVTPATAFSETELSHLTSPHDGSFQRVSSSSEPLITEKDISENNDAENELTQLVLSGESVALVGAGYSRDCGFPSWAELIEQLRIRAEAINPEWNVAVSSESLLDRAETIRECITAARGTEAFGNAVGRIFRAAEQAMKVGRDGLPVPGLDDETSRPNAKQGLHQFHIDLARLPFRGFLTTNYDYMLEHALTSSGRCSEPPTPVPVWGGDPTLISRAIRELAVAESVQHVIHLHGDYRQQRTVILTRSEYSEAYGMKHARRSRLFHLLAGILMTRRLTFVGFSLQDEYIEEMLSLVSELGWEWGEPIHFAILPRFEDTWPEDRTRASRLREELGIQVVFYDARPNDHSELHALIGRIYKAYEAAHVRSDSPAPALPGPIAVLPNWARKANQAALEKVGGDEN